MVLYGNVPSKHPTPMTISMTETLITTSTLFIWADSLRPMLRATKKPKNEQVLATAIFRAKISNRRHFIIGNFKKEKVEKSGSSFSLEVVSPQFLTVYKI